MKEVFKPSSNITHTAVIQAIKKANNIQETMLKKIVQEPQFYMSNTPSSVIATKINLFIEADEQMEVHIYYPRWRWSKAIGYYDPRYPRNIYLNGYKLGRTQGSIVATLWHELVHAVDDIYKDLSFGHGNNTWTPEKEESAPYKIDYIAEVLVSNSVPVKINDKPINKYIKKATIWYKPWTWFNFLS